MEKQFEDAKAIFADLVPAGSNIDVGSIHVMSGECGLEAVAGLENKWRDEFVNIALSDEHLDYQMEFAIEDGMRLESIPTRLLHMPTIADEYRDAPICRHCGTKVGFASGTGDCGCKVDQPSAWDNGMGNHW